MATGRAVTSAQRVLGGKKTTKKKLASLMKIAAGLGGVALAGYAAYLARSSKFAKLAKAAANATANARARSVNGAPTTKGLLSKIKSLLVGAGAAAGLGGGLGLGARRRMMQTRRKNIGFKAWKKNIEHGHANWSGIGARPDQAWLPYVYKNTRGRT